MAGIMTPPVKDEPVVGSDAGVLEVKWEVKAPGTSRLPLRNGRKAPAFLPAEVTDSRVPAPPWLISTYARSMPREGSARKGLYSQQKVPILHARARMRREAP